jgi:hypothetical protein
VPPADALQTWFRARISGIPTAAHNVVFDRRRPV